MGDRANIVVRDLMRDPGEREAVFLYGHWSGHELPEILRQALAKRWRWNDGAYLARIVFEVMVGEARGNETGFGISTRMPDNEYDLLVLDVANQRVCRLGPDAYAERAFAALGDCPSISFEDYVASSERTWENLTSPSAAA